MILRSDYPQQCNVLDTFRFQATQCFTWGSWPGSHAHDVMHGMVEDARGQGRAKNTLQSGQGVVLCTAGVREAEDQHITAIKG